MKRIAFFLVMIATSSVVKAQVSNLKKITLIADAFLTDQTIQRGFVHSITDSAVYLMDINKPVYTDVNKSLLYKIDPSLIEEFRMRRKGQIGKGIAIGMLAGAAIGTIVGFATYRDPGPNAFLDFGPGFNALGGGLIGLLSGGGLGAVIAIPSKKYRINGDKKEYQNMQKEFNKRILLK